MGRAQVGNALQRVPVSGVGNGISTSSGVILFCFTAGSFIPHASSSLHEGSGVCDHLAAPFVRLGVYTRALYRGANQVQGAGRSEGGR